MNTKKILVSLKTKKKDDEDRKEKIKQKLETISNFEDLEEKAVDKIDKMCINIVQMKFLSIKND